MTILPWSQQSRMTNCGQTNTHTHHLCIHKQLPFEIEVCPFRKTGVPGINTHWYWLKKERGRNQEQSLNNRKQRGLPSSACSPLSKLPGCKTVSQGTVSISRPESKQKANQRIWFPSNPFNLLVITRTAGPRCEVTNPISPVFSILLFFPYHRRQYATTFRALKQPVSRPIRKSSRPFNRIAYLLLALFIFLAIVCIEINMTCLLLLVLLEMHLVFKDVTPWAHFPNKDNGTFTKERLGKWTAGFEDEWRGVWARSSSK